MALRAPLPRKVGISKKLSTCHTVFWCDREGFGAACTEASEGRGGSDRTDIRIMAQNLNF